MAGRPEAEEVGVLVDVTVEARTADSELIGVLEEETLDEGARLLEETVVEEPGLGTIALLEGVTTLLETVSEVGLDREMLVGEGALLDEMIPGEEEALVDAETTVEEAILLDGATLVEEAILLDEATLVEEGVLLDEVTLAEEEKLLDEVTLVEDGILLEGETLLEGVMVLEDAMLLEDVMLLEEVTPLDDVDPHPSRIKDVAVVVQLETSGDLVVDCVQKRVVVVVPLIVIVLTWIG